MAALRIYVDSSVFGGYFDEEFAEASRMFFNFVNQGRIIILVSEFVIRELVPAPEKVRTFVAALPRRSLVNLSTTPAAIQLRDAYLRARILGPGSMIDAAHVALATVAHSDAIVSWNFKHIVRVDKMRAFNAVNLSEGYGLLSIVSPNEVRFDDDS